MTDTYIHTGTYSNISQESRCRACGPPLLVPVEGHRITTPSLPGVRLHDAIVRLKPNRDHAKPFLTQASSRKVQIIVHAIHGERVYSSYSNVTCRKDIGSCTDSKPNRYTSSRLESRINYPSWSWHLICCPSAVWGHFATPPPCLLLESQLPIDLFIHRTFKPVLVIAGSLEADVRCRR